MQSPLQDRGRRKCTRKRESRPAKTPSLGSQSELGELQQVLLLEAQAPVEVAAGPAISGPRLSGISSLFEGSGNVPVKEQLREEAIFRRGGIVGATGV